MTGPGALTYAGAVYLDRGRFLDSGQVRPLGFSLRTEVVDDMAWLFRAGANGLEGTSYDACEMSLATYISMIARGDRRLVAIPVFPSRAFRHGQVYVRTDLGIDSPSELRGRRIGTGEYRQTAAVWIRAFLQHDHGVAPEDVEWVTGGLRVPGHVPREPSPLPSSLTIRTAPPQSTLEEMLLDGELDALVTVREPRGFDWRGRGPVQRLFADHRAVELDYYRRTGIFPIMHTVALRAGLYEQFPWVARQLFDAFEADRVLARERHLDSGMPSVMHPWITAEIASLDVDLAGDPFRYGFEASRNVVGRLCRHLYEQGLSDRIVTPAELFAVETLDT